MNNLEVEHDVEYQIEKITDDLLNFCRAGNYKQVVHLFDKYFDNPGFDINCRDYEGNTPIILAAKQGHGSIIQELLRYVPDITLENKKGVTVMKLSTTAIQKMIFGSISSCIKYSDRLFCNACWLGNIEVVERCLTKEPDRIHLNLRSLDGYSCYLLTLKNMNLLESIAIKNKFSYKPAQVLQSLLIHMGHFPIDDLLLHVASTKLCQSSVEVARVLLRKNFEILSKDEFDFTPIHYAARSGNSPVLELFLSKIDNKPNKSSFLDCQGRAGNTPLHLAATEGREDCVRILLAHGAATDLVNSQNYTPLQLAKSVRIKNLFLQSNQPQKDKFLPDLPFVLSRANTSMPQTPNKRLSDSGKKSAEPTYKFREKSMLATEVVMDELVDSSANFDRKFPAILITPLTKSTELTISHEQLFPRSKLSHSITLECLNEEIFLDQSSPIEENPQSPEEPDKKIPIVAKNGSKRRVPNSIKAPTKSKMPQRSVKPANKPEKPKPNNGTNNQKRKSAKKTQEDQVADMTFVKIPVIPEVVYESDFNTDSGSMTEEEKEKKRIGDQRQWESDSDEEDLSRTLTATMTARMSTRMSDHIEWKRGEQLGKGSYGTVWKGMLEDGQYIAVKEIVVTEDDDALDSPIGNLEEIRREIEILQTIRHRNIVKYLGACDSTVCIHIFMEFVSGGSIAFILSKFGGFSEKIIRIYSKQIVTAIAFLYERSIIHRDLKGANIMVTPRGVIKIVDFGCAKRLEHFSNNSQSLTQQSRLKGSVYWLAPEVINGGKHSHRSDIWSIGCSVIEMITTKPPWAELHPYAAMFAIGSGKRPSLEISQYVSSSGDTFSQQIAGFVELCLTKDPSSRPTALELLECAFLK